MDNSIKEKIKNHILEHGFLLEEETKNILEKDNWRCERSTHFQDQDEPNKSREIDVTALKYEWYNNFEPQFRVGIRFDLVVECKSYNDIIIFLSTQKTREDLEIFLAKELINFLSPYDSLYIPDKENPNSKHILSVEEYLEINKYHHFFNENRKATNLVLARVKDNYRFSANIYQETIIPIIKAILSHKQKLKNHVDILSKGKFLKSFGFLIPVLVTDNKFYEAFFENNELIIEEREYLQFITDYRSRNVDGRFQIDIVNKKYLEKYLQKKLKNTITQLSGIILNKFNEIIKYQKLSG